MDIDKDKYCYELLGRQNAFKEILSIINGVEYRMKYTDILKDKFKQPYKEE